MNTENIKKLDNLYYYKTKEFATTIVRHIFNFENTEENIVKASILSKYLKKTNKVYKTGKDISDRSKELYSSEVKVYPIFFGIKTLMCFSLEMPNPRLIGEDYFDDSLKYYGDIMLKPNFTSKKLDNEIFNQIKIDLLNNHNNLLKNPDYMSDILLHKKILPDSNINNSFIIDDKKYKKIIDNITEENIVDFYNELLNNFVTSFAFGNLLDKEVKLIRSTFNFKSINFDYKYDTLENIVSGDISYVSKDTTQSYIYFVYEIKDFKKDNSHIYDALSMMLNNQNGPIFNTFRTKLGIVYSAGAYIMQNRNFMYVKASIDKKNEEKARNGIKEVFEIMHDKKEVENLLKYAKERKKELLISWSENVSVIVNEVQYYALKFSLPGKIIEEKINNLTVDEIINQVNNFDYKCSFFYKGDKTD